MTAPRSVARLKITLDDVEPAVMRRLDVPLDLRLDRLHLVIQAAMGWTNSHLYEFRDRGIGWGIPDPDVRGFSADPLDASKATLLEVIEDSGVRTVKYLYDFGDGWEHTVEIERIGRADPQASYPALIDAVGRCPPEDVGGPLAYEEFLVAIADPSHKRHAERREWIGDDFDPNDFDAAEIGMEIQKMARKWISEAKSRPKRTQR
ncbi:pRiA4b ORF-3-like protein [Rhizobiales bacterium GAS191]|nr:pRiA4b ORF-3-like protein [Rhizobiales bacterium GAS191]